MIFEFESQEQLIELTRRLIVAMSHERYWTKRWQKHYGSANRKAMDNWNERSDSLIRELKIEDNDLNNLSSKIKINVKTPDV